jgi:hypothetical protein
MPVNILIYATPELCYIHGDHCFQLGTLRKCSGFICYLFNTDVTSGEKNIQMVELKEGKVDVFLT